MERKGCEVKKVYETIKKRSAGLVLERVLKKVVAQVVDWVTSASKLSHEKVYMVRRYIE